MSEYDEYTFLCGYQRIRRYGSTNDLNQSIYGFRKFSRIVQHEVQPTDTLQSLELKYNSSMFEIKRINRLWSNSSLYCKTHISIPLFDDETLPAVIPVAQLTSKNDATMTMTTIAAEVQQDTPPTKKRLTLDSVREHATGDESVHDFFNRIDSNVKKTKSAVKRLDRKS